MTIYEIDAAIMSLIDEETGEIKDYEALKNLEMDREQKIVNVIRYIKNSKIEMDALAKEEKILSDRKNRKKEGIEKAKKFLADALNGDKFKSSDGMFQVYYQTSNSVQVPDIWQLPEEFLKYSDPVAKKEEIALALKAGKKVNGAFFETTKSVVVR